MIRSISIQQVRASNTRSIEISNRTEESDRLIGPAAALAYEAFTVLMLASAELVGATGRSPILLAILNGSQQAIVDDFIFASRQSPTGNHSDEHHAE